MRTTLALATLFAYTTAIALQTEEETTDTPLVSVCVNCTINNNNYNDDQNEKGLPRFFASPERITGATAAEAYCVENGGHLASIHNEIEQFLLAEAARSIYPNGGWIFAGGARRTFEAPGAYTESTWFWDDGTPWDYELNWDGGVETGLCGEMYAYALDNEANPGKVMWDADPCDTFNKYVLCRSDD